MDSSCNSPTPERGLGSQPEESSRPEAIEKSSNVQPDVSDVPGEKVEREAGLLAVVPEEAQLTRQSTPGPYTIFTGRQKSMILFIITVAATFSGLSGNIYFPAIPTIASDLSVSEEAVTLTVTTYMIFQGISPSFWGALADVRGRRITYFLTFLVYIGACIGLAETKHYYQLVILRCLQSTGSASTIAIGAGIVGDITTREERGGYMGIYGGGLLAPVAIGPILGGAFSGTLGWRAIFWFLTIFSGSFLLIILFFLPETLRSLVGNGSIPAKGVAKSPLAYLQRRRLSQSTTVLERQQTSISIPKPATTRHVNVFSSLQILFEKEVTLIILFLSIYYTGWQMVIASMSTLFERTYSLTSIQSGLTFIANGVGCVLGTLLTGRFLDWDFHRLKTRFDIQQSTLSPSQTRPDFPLEHARLRSLALYAPIEILSLILFGWTVAYEVHISVPIIAVFFLGWASTSIQSVINTLLVDLFPKRGASATAALNLARCLLGAAGTAGVLPMVDSRLGVGGGFTLVAGICATAIGLLGVQVRWGPGWRKSRKEREKELEKR